MAVRFRWDHRAKRSWHARAQFSIPPSHTLIQGDTPLVVPVDAAGERHGRGGRSRLTRRAPYAHESATGHRRAGCTRLMRVTEIRPAADAEAAQWLLRSDVDWWDLVRYGPPGFDVYVRIAFPQDFEADANNPSGEAPVDAVRAALAILGSYTTTSSKGYAAIWEGWVSGASAPQAPRVEI